MATISEPPCTCGRGTMFYSHLHDADCPFASAGVLPPQSKQERELESLRADKTRLDVLEGLALDGRLEMFNCLDENDCLWRVWLNNEWHNFGSMRDCADAELLSRREKEE